MKKVFAVLLALSLLCVSFAAVADMEIPTWADMPLIVIEDDDTVVEEAAFEGEWVLNVAFLGEDYLSTEELAEAFDFNFMPIRIGDGKIQQDIQDENGEFRTLETVYVFEAGELHGTDGTGVEYAVDLLEDGNIAVSVFVPGEGDEIQCLTLFMMHPAE